MTLYQKKARKKYGKLRARVKRYENRHAIWTFYLWYAFRMQSVIQLTAKCNVSCVLYSPSKTRGKVINLTCVRYIIILHG